MNLYVVLAIALGAISGVSQPPAARNGRSAVVAADVRAVESEVDDSGAHEARVREPRAQRTAIVSRAQETTPLAGAATPRAPSPAR
ncbi:MAG: hypothetical protein JOZ54_24385 [Acidobacteria bacterium]|nr:hypothetical protein [Acidobacteriota bacterium]